MAPKTQSSCWYTNQGTHDYKNVTRDKTPGRSLPYVDGFFTMQLCNKASFNEIPNLKEFSGGGGEQEGEQIGLN